MKKLIFKAGALALANAFLGLLFLALFDARLDYTPWETDSILQVMPSDKAFSAVVLGSSHTYVLSRLEANHPHVEAAVDGPAFNLALPTGGGIWPAKIYLKEFLAQGNTAKKLIYLIEPFVFYNDKANTAHKFVYFEPLRLGFLARLVGEGYPPRRIFTYIRSKFTRDYLTQTPKYMDALDGIVRPEQVTEANQKERLRTLYLEGQQEEIFALYLNEFRQILDIAKAQGMTVHLITPPTLIGHEPGQPALEAALNDLAKEYSFTYTDLTYAMPDPSLYYNYDHMNTRGVETFCRDFLKPALADRQTMVSLHE